MGKNTVIRDVIHLDIEFNSKMSDIMDTPEFQRLHRIKQLSCEYLVFPTATHTRFSHSIGCYCIMGRLIEHFKNIMKDMDLTVSKEEEDLALVAALLHDLGHGPFSHTFEKIFGYKSHEMWTTQIIENEDTLINQKLKYHYGEEFIKRLVCLIEKDYKSENDDGIFGLISTLVSSQTDADRMDYLLRDSYFTSVTNGNFDLHRLIKSFGAEKNSDGKIMIYINEKYMSTLEEYVLARYFMYNEVYQHYTKKHMEKIMQKIFQRAGELSNSSQDKIKSKILENEIITKLLRKENLSVKEYLSLDDNVLMYVIGRWEELNDEILSTLCANFLHRKKDCWISIKKDEKKIKDDINAYLSKNNKTLIENMSEQYYFIGLKKELTVYGSSKENIWIKPKGGDSLVDLTEISSIVTKDSAKKAGKKSIKNLISPEIFKLVHGIDFPSHIV